MMKFSWNLYFCSIFLIAGGAAAFVAITHKIAGPANATSAIMLATTATIVASITLASMWAAQNIGARYILLTKTSFLLTASVFMVEIGGPIFYVIPPTSWQGASILAGIITTAACNSVQSYRHYKLISITLKKDILESIKGNLIDLDLFGSFFLDYPPTIASKLNPRVAASIAILGGVCMTLGLSLYKLYPSFSVFAWGIPTLLVPAFLLPVLTQGLVQQQFLAKIEKQIGRRLAAKTAT